MSRKTDPRVIRTRQMLRDALVALILEQGYDPLTIQDITEKAGLRRATFYLHYRDKEELLFSILQETFDALVCEIDKLRIQHLTPESELAVHEVIFKHVQENANLYRSILSGHGAATITRYTREYLANEFVKDYTERCVDQEPIIPIEVLANYSASTKLSMVIWWLEKGMPYSPRQMAELCTKLTLHGTLSAFVEKAIV